MLVDLVIVCLLLLAASFGYRRGGLLTGLELGSFAFATTVAFVLYRPLGALLQSTGVPPAGAHVGAFVAIWIVAEVAGALGLRALILRRVGHGGGSPARASQVAGAVLNVIKYGVGIIIAFLVASAMPMPEAVGQTLASSSLNRSVLMITKPLQHWLGQGIGRDVAQLFNLYTYTTSTEATKTVKLSFTTTNGKVSERSEAAMLVLVNQERTSRGLPALSINPIARVAARSYSTRMLADGLFAHIDSDGKSPFDRLRAVGAQFNAAGENLALAPTLESAHQGLMNSPAHRANILSKDFKRIGIGIIDAGPYGLMVTQEFTD